MAPKTRTTDKHLPQHVYYKHNAFYFVDHNKKWRRLGKTFTEAMTAYALLAKDDERNESVSTMNQLFDRYLVEVAPTKAKKTCEYNQYSMAKLKAVFGDMSPDKITPVIIYKYLDIRGQKAKRAANIEKALLSHVFTMAIRWGAIQDNPCRHVKRLPEEKRDRYITDKEFLAVQNISSSLIRFAMEFAYLTGLRRGDILTMRMSDLTEEGIRVKTNKTGAKILIEWSEELSQCVNNIKSLKRPISGLYLFCNRKGQPYTPSGFNAIWQRTIRKAFKNGVIEERFRFHDIRRKAATDAQEKSGLEYARRLLGHETQAMTANYISGEGRVKPLK